MVLPSLFPPPGPPLPPFKSLLVSGTFHPSAPIHLACSSISSVPENEALIVSPSRPSFKHALQVHNDDWLTTSPPDGFRSSLLSRVNIRYMPSPSHLCLLLGLMQKNYRKKTEQFSPIHPTDIRPSIIVLYELSAFFLRTGSSPNQYTFSHEMVSSYMSLILRAFALINPDFGSEPPTIALFDSQLESIVFSTRQRMTPLGLNLSIRISFESGDAFHESMAKAVGKYFDCIIVFENDSIPSS